MSDSAFNLNLAIVVGINHYQNGIPTLGTAKEDAEAIATILENDYKYDVHLLTDKQATGQGLKNWLETELPQQLEKDHPSRLVFYFAGHGIALNGDDGPQGYLIPQDAKLGDVTTYLPMQQVEAALTKLSCRHCLVILDCCFAGAFRWSSTRKLSVVEEIIHKERFDRFIKDPAWQVITSAASDQFALDNLDLNSDRRIAKENSHHSPFAAALMEALGDKADAYPPAKNGKPPGDGIITATELYLYLRDAVEVPTDARNQRQTPQIWCLKKHDKGEFIFLPPGHEFNLPPAPTLDNLEENNPYRGLKSYETKDSDLFFGRTSLIEKLYHTVSDRPLTVVLGASGSGKSSLVKAGLIPSLSLNRVYQWHSLSPIRPGESPLNSLNSVLKELGNVTTEQVNSQIFIEAIAVWSKANPQTKLLLVVDQLEELITLCRNDEEKQQFLEILATLINTFPDVMRLVVTLRSDFEPQLRNTPLESLWQAGRFVVPAMTREELRSVIEEPASAKVVYFESLDDPDKGYLVDRLIDEVAGMPGALPLLSFALSELYLKLVRRYLEAQNAGDTVERAITWADYDALGGVTKSLTQRADEIYEELVKVDPAYEKTIRNVMLRMVAVGGELARRQVPELELQYPEPENGRVQKVLNEFLSARLLVSGTDAEGKVYIEPAHDALIRGWEKLSIWKKEEGENLGLQRRLTPAAIEWNTVKTQDKEQAKSILSKTDSTLNWLDKRLFWGENLVNQIPTQIARLLHRDQNQRGQLKNKPLQFLWDSNPSLGVLDKELSCDDNWLNQVEKEFVQESILQKRRNISWRRRIVIAVMLGLSGLTIFALNQRKISIARQIAAQSQLIKEQQISLLPRSVLLAIEAMRMSPSLEGDQALRSGLALLARPVANMRHESRVNAVVFSPDGKYLASASTDKTAKVWETKSGRKVFQLPHKDTVNKIVFSPDGQYLATASDDKTAGLWETASGRKIFQLPHESSVHKIVFSPDSRYLATSDDKTTRLWETVTGRAVFVLPHENGINTITFSPNGRYLAITSDSMAQVWEVSSHQKITHLKHKDGVTDIALSPDGQYLATASVDGTAKLWKIPSGQEITSIKHEAFVERVAFSPNGKYLVTTSGTSGGILVAKNFVTRVFETASNREVARIPNETVMTHIAFSPDSQFLATEDQVWELANGKEIIRLQPEQKATAIAFSPDGKYLATGNGDGGVQVSDFTQDGRFVLLIKQTQVDDEHWTMSLNRRSLDGKYRFYKISLKNKYLITVGDDYIAKIYEATSGREVAQVNHGASLDNVEFSSDGKYIVTMGGNFIQVWQSSNGKKVAQIASTDEYKDLSSNNQYLVTQDSKNNTIRVWDVANGKEVAHFNHSEGGELAVAFSPDSKYLATLIDNGAKYNGTNRFWIARVWEINSKQKIAHLQYQTTPFDGGGGYSLLNSIAFSSDSKFFTTRVSESGDIRLWNTHSGKSIASLPLKGKLLGTAFSSDGRYLATTTHHDSTIRVWEIPSGKEIIQMRKKVDLNVQDVALSSDGKYLATAGEDYTARVWEVASGKEVIRLQHESVVDSVDFSPDGKSLTTYSTDEVLRVWPLSQEYLITDACSRLTRNLTQEEWQQYLGGGIPLLDRYRKTCPNLE